MGVVVKTKAQADACIAEVIQVLRKHGFALGHEDGHGGFEIWERESMNEPDAIKFHDNWLADARLHPTDSYRDTETTHKP